MVVKSLFKKGEPVRFVPDEDVRQYLIRRWKDAWVSSIDEGESATVRKMINDLIRQAMRLSSNGTDGIASTAGNGQMLNRGSRSQKVAPAKGPKTTRTNR